MVRAPEPKKTKLCNWEVGKLWPDKYTADHADKTRVVAFLREVGTFLAVLAPFLVATPPLEWAAAFRDSGRGGRCASVRDVPHKPLVTADGSAGGFGTLHIGVQRRCREQAQGQPRRQMGSMRGGYSCSWSLGGPQNDSMSLLAMIMHTGRSKDLIDTGTRDYQIKFDRDDIPDKVRQAAVAPEAVVGHRLAGRRDLDTCEMVRRIIDDKT